MTIVHEPGSVRAIRYNRPRADGKYPVTYWGSVEEQIAEATLRNAHATSRFDHSMMPLWTYAHDCGHTNPEEDERFFGLDDLVDEWMERNCAGLKFDAGVSWDLVWKNQKRAHVSIPLYVEWQQAQDAYDAVHDGNICRDQYQGECCTECTEGDDDFGYEPVPCRLPEWIREAYDEFWWQVSAEGAADRARKDAA